MSGMFYLKTHYFLFLCLFADIVRKVRSSLLSRKKNLYEFIERQHFDAFTSDSFDFEYSTENIPTQTLSDQLQKTPLEDNEEIQTLSNMQDVLYNTTNALIEITKMPQDSQNNTNINEHKEKLKQVNVSQYTTSPLLETTIRNKLLKTRTKIGKRKVQFKTIHDRNKRKLNTKRIKAETTGTHVKSWCYSCGLNDSNIPSSTCYNTFEGKDDSRRKDTNRFKIKCIQSRIVKQFRNKYYGPLFIGGCFKRFLDMGTVYNERGCRTYEPTMGKSFASERLSKLEYILRGVDNGCIHSPYASLTPFSRAISLYVRYHVCVCNTKYCNNSLMLRKSMSFWCLLITLYITNL